MKTEKRSRFRAESRGESFRLTPIDVEVLALLQRYRYLPSNYIAALLALKGDYYKDILHKLRHRAGLIDCPPASWAAVNARYRPAVYCLTDNGAQALKHLSLYAPRPKTGHEFNHELGVCLIRASFEIGAREHGLQLITAEDILDHPNCPAHTRHQKNPWPVPVSFDWTFDGRKTRVEQVVKTDGEFFALARPHAGGRTTLAFPGFEFDRRTEPLEPADYERPSIKKKILAFRAIAGQAIYRSRFGLPNAIIPFITTNEYHMRSMMKVVEVISNGHGSKLFIFKSLPNFSAFESFPPPTGHMLTASWHRVGHPPFDILEELGIRNQK
jgi:hypothetical protein